MRFKKVYIEISNVCNLQCSFCPEVVRDKSFMPADVFEKTIRSVAPLADEVCFHLMGEPLLHPNFDSYVRFCDSQSVKMNITTNGLLLKDERFQALLTRSVKQVNFSLQSFESNFPNKDDSSYLQKIFDFTRRAQQDRPDLYINYRLWNHGAIGFEESNQKLIQKIKQGLSLDFDATTDIRHRKSVKMTRQVSLHFDSRFEWPNPHHPVRATRGFCHGLSSHIGILVDGTVVPCCLDKEGVINLGNCHSQKLVDIVESPRARAIRDGFEKKILVEDLCQRCTFIERFDKKVGLKKTSVVR